MKEMHQDRIALDRATVSARTFDEGSGHMHVAGTNISKAAVNPYNGSEIPYGEELGLDPDRVYRLLRHPDELAKSVQTFNGKPLLMVHRVQDVADGDHQNRVGAVSNAKYEHPFLKADLALWSKDAIEAVESGAQRELSCGYHYKPVMTPGSFDGEPYDGIMTEIGGNHVALVKEGRAGADCHVFDSTENLKGLEMKKAILSRKAIAAQGALVGYLAPKLAQDAKIDLTPTFKDVTAANYKDKTKSIAADVVRQIKDKLAKDENVALEQVAAVLEAVASVDPVEPEVVDTVDPDLTQDDDDADLVAKLVAKGYSEEEAKKIAARTPAPAAADEEDEEKKDNDPKAAMDRAIKNATKGMVSKTAMDQALAEREKATESRVIDRLNGIHEAKEFVDGWVGKLPGMSFDSAEGVYRQALKMLGVDSADKLHPDALRPILESKPKPGERKPRETSVAMDSAAASGFAERYPDAARVRLM